MLDTSQLRQISIGYVAENKLRTSPEVEISLVELTPFQNGEVVSGYLLESVSGYSPDGSAQTFSIKTSNTVMATWLGDGTNRVTAPDVRRGERVGVFQLGSNDKFYWNVINIPGETTRKKETVVELFNNSTDEKDNTQSESNSWIKEFSTHDKRITIKTNKSDNEKFAYTMQLDVAKANVVVADDVGNYIQLNSEDQTIELETAAGASIVLNLNDIAVTCRNFKLNASGNVEITGSKGTFVLPKTEWTGAFSMGGGAAEFNGATNFTTSVSHMGKSIGIDHTHGGVDRGNSNTSGVT
jgi:hypothetical protein